MTSPGPKELTYRTWLTHCGLVTPYGSRDLSQHWFRQWLVAWWHQAITWTNVDLSSLRSSDVHLRAISLEISEPSVTKIRLNFFLLKSPRDQRVKHLKDFTKVTWIVAWSSGISLALCGGGEWGDSRVVPQELVIDFLLFMLELICQKIASCRQCPEPSPNYVLCKVSPAVNDNDLELQRSFWVCAQPMGDDVTM